MDEFKHPLFFEAKDLTDKEKDKVRRHFQKRRDSGGGDCGMIEKAGGNMYTICFKEIEDQERVLQRKFHSISLPSGDLCLNTTTKVNTKGLEKMFKLDIFLMYFLRDNLKAYKLLQKQLSCIGSQVELDFEEEEAVVRGDIEKGPGGAFGASEQWELQVDRVLINFTENYLCYHVVEPKKAKILLQDLSFVTDDIKVYREGGYPVVVGETEAVREKIAILEKSLPTRKELPMVEKLFKLVEEEFSREMLAKYPEVKINIGSAMVTLEGPDKEVQSGANTLEDLKQKVKEKRVKLSTALMTFLGSSGAVSKYQTRFQQRLRNPVSLEVGSEVVMSSLSSDALDEAEATLQRDFDVANVELQEALAAPPDLDGLKEILFKAKNEANSREFRVDVSFIPGTGGTPNTKVRLVGYRENVNKLKEVLHDYQINQIWTQEVLNLPNPDLLDCFDKILGMIGMKQSKVTLKASLYPYPCVLVSGPCRLVNEAKQGLISAIASLTSDTLVLDGPGALQYFQAEGKVGKELVESSFQVIVKEQQGVHSANVQSKPQSISSPLTSGLANGPLPRLRCNTVGSNVAIKTSLEIKLGSLIDAQANVMVVPMLNKNLTSTKIGKHLFQKAGNAIKSKFDSVAANCTVAPGDVLQVAAPPTLGCSRLFFIECLPWDGVRGQSVKALGNGLKRCLDLCVQQGYSTVAFPVIGPGVVLKYPMKEAIQLLMENICQLGLSASSGSLTTIQIVIKPGYPDSEECYQDVYRHPGLNVNQGGQGPSPVTLMKSMTVGGGVKLQLVFGDITDETTDAVVNTTDFVDFQTVSVCKDILTVAGADVEAELKAAKYTRGDVFVSQSGEFPCEALFHVCGQKDAVVIEQLVIRIVEHCESFRFESVAIPAISAGAGGLDPCVVARAVLRGVKDATSSFGLNSLTDIRLVLLKINVFLAFKEEAMQMFSTAVINKVASCTTTTTSSSLEADLSIICNSSTSQQSVFRFLGLSRKDVDGAMTKLTDLYQAQCYSQTFRKEELKDLTQDDVKDLKQLVETEGLYVELSQGTFKVSGLNNGVNKVMQMINASLHGNLRREVRVREEEDLYVRVAWCILGHRGNWERLPKTANHSLENNDVGGRIWMLRDKWTGSAEDGGHEYLGGQTTKLKRLEHLDFTLPLYWDNMAAGEALKTVELLPSYAEYRTVKEAFKRTVGKTVLKIERLQNVHLRRAYEAQKKQISDKYKQQGGECEKLLYHGTTQDNCESIVKTGFNRRFSGQNAADGSQLMFVARVLTGIYTQGQQNMRVPPPVSNQGGDRYDSVVDRVDNPQMYVILGMIGMKQSKVTLKASLYPYPCVLVSGPCRLVNEAKQGLISAIASLTSDTLVLDGPGALQYFQAEGKVGKELVESSFQVIVKEQQGVHSANVQSKPQSISSPLTSGLANGPLPRLRCNTVGSNVAIKTSLEIKLGSLIDAQANVMVVPMLNKNLTSTKIGKHLFQKAGNAIKSKFDSVAANCTVAPGDVLQVAAPPTLGCSRLFFIECLPWDGVRGQSVKALGNGLKRCLDLCVQQGYSTVAFPVIGPGVVLKYPMKEAIQLLMENICQLGLSASSGSLTTIQIVIKPGYPDSEECYQDVYRHPGLNVNQGGQAIFRALTSDLDEITMTVGGGVKLQLVFGDITDETTDAVVNTTDFVYFQNGVCKDILTVAGADVEAELKAAKYTRGDVFVSQSGEFPCEALFHVCGQKDAVVIEQLVIRIVEHCESFRFESVAIPAISAGEYSVPLFLDIRIEMSWWVGPLCCGKSRPPRGQGCHVVLWSNSLTDIRLVLLKINVFLAFKEEAMQMFSTAVINKVSVPQLPHVQQQQHPSSLEADLSIICNSSTSQQSVFRFLGLSRKDVDGAMTKLTDLYQAQCYSQTFRKEELKDLTQDDVKDLKQLVETEGLYVELSQGTFKVSGLNNGVNKVMQMINASLHGNLRREVRVREEEDLYARVAWCILGHRGNWERLPKTANHSLENNDVGGRIVDAQGNKWTMDLPRMEATKYLGGQTTKLKRLEHLDFTLPLYWDNMAAGEALKTVELLPSYAEYRTVKEAFKRTVGKTVLKIERLQNVHLRRAYEAQKKQISDKYKQQGGECEKLLYHGTTQDNCESIVKTGFNRRFSGQNAADGSQLMFVARVLTGIYTQGQQNMRVPPPVSNQGGDRYDSVVDRVDNPQIIAGKMDEFKHPLFFEAKDLTDKEKDKVRRHFQKRRDSGGGDCGMIEKAGGNMYTICFKEIEDQERVLQRKFHNISLSSGDLCLNVSRSYCPETPDQPSTSQPKTTTKVNTKGPEKIFKLDIFLMYFLRDNLKAYKLLQKRLSCIGSQVEFDFEEEEAVVRGDIEKGPGGAFGAAEQWELQVDRVLINFTENYLCYHVVEPKKAKILLQDLSFVTDDIKVYREGGYPVVVGETEAVREKIAILEKSLPTRKELPMVEKLFKLVEEEFSREMHAKYPEVKINIGSAMVTLEGPDKEVQSGANTLEDLKQKVKEKRVKLSTALMTFLGSSGAVSKYQTRFQQRL
ncbi:hypothetical protein F7725_004643 [Dissostichus mawsoni]|uniref:PARP n=1 Tax=Dissostichus mawsoni TaxID=36200 RepID=A0A7J5XKS4_DISMA|nr:hypothetical protein F7725_004643 [Dissostichus mawsoni]